MMTLSRGVGMGDGVCSSAQTLDGWRLRLTKFPAKIGASLANQGSSTAPMPCALALPDLCAASRKPQEAGAAAAKQARVASAGRVTIHPPIRSSRSLSHALAHRSTSLFRTPQLRALHLSARPTARIVPRGTAIPSNFPFVLHWIPLVQLWPSLLSLSCPALSCIAPSIPLVPSASPDLPFFLTH